MWKRIFLPIIVVLCALSVSTSAAFFSVYGLSKLFAGASFAIIIMATSLEISKLAIVSLLHQYWNILPRLLKFYFITASTVLIFITSAGIYGFLSNAYQVTATQNEVVQKEISVIEYRKSNYETQLADYNAEKQNIVNDISELRKSLSSGTQVQYIDKESGQLITTSSRSIRQSFEKQLDDALARRNDIDAKAEVLNDSIVSLELQVIEIENSNTAAAELGPLIYLNKLTGIPMERLVNWLLIIIVFVFDPLAVCLVIAANNIFGLKRIDSNETSEDVEPKSFDDLYENENPPSPDPTSPSRYVATIKELDQFAESLKKKQKDRELEEGKKLKEPEQEEESKKIVDKLDDKEESNILKEEEPRELSNSQKRNMTAFQIHQSKKKDS